MNKNFEPEGLLAETLAEAAPPDFRAALLAETLRHARSRRRWRQTRQTGGVLAIALLAAALAWPRPDETFARSKTEFPIAAPESFRLVETRQLPPDAIVSTRAFPATKMFSTTGGAVEITTVAGGFRFINDAQLLALAGGVPVILIRTGPDTEELVFANPDDRKKFFGN